MSPQLFQRDASCPNSGVFYSCDKGFVGCCLVEACNPGIGCPAGQDRTPSRWSSPSASATTIAVTSSTSPTPTLTTSYTTSAFSSTLVSMTSTSAFAILATGVPATESPKPSQSGGDSVPTAAIVGAVLGSIILIATILGLLFCLRDRKGTKVYKAAEYPWPHVGSDMSPQLPDCQEPQTSRFAGLIGTKQKFEHQLDSREVLPAIEMSEATPRHILCAELPASNSSVRNI